MSKPPLFLYKIDLIEDYLIETTGLEIDRIKFAQDGNNIHVKYFGYNKKEEEYKKYSDTFHIFDFLALIYNKQDTS